MPFLRLELDALPKIAPCARAARVDPGAIMWGLVQAWEWCWREKRTRVSLIQIEGFFGADVSKALEAFGFVNDPESGSFEIAGAGKYLRISRAQKEGGKASKSNLKVGRSSPGSDQILTGSSASSGRDSPADSVRFSGSTASSDQRTASSEQRTPPYPPRGGAGGDPPPAPEDSIRDRLEAAHREVRGSEYTWRGAPGQGDDALVYRLAVVAKNDWGLVERVWRRALGMQFPLCLDVGTLVKNWSIYAGRDPPGTQRDPHKAPVRAEDVPRSAFAKTGDVTNEF